MLDLLGKIKLLNRKVYFYDKKMESDTQRRKDVCKKCTLFTESTQRQGGNELISMSF